MRAEIEAQGWTVVDRGTEARLVRAHPPDVIDPDVVTRYGWSGAVPERAAHEPGTARESTPLTVILRALPMAEATDSLITRFTGGGTYQRHFLVVAGEGQPDPTLTDIEVIRLRGEVGPGTLLAVALRRVAEGVVVVGDRWPGDPAPGDIDVLAERLDDETAVAGLVGLGSQDLRRFTSAGAAHEPAAAVDWAGLTFRAVDGRARGPVDEGFSDPRLLAAWWSLALRDGEPPRCAMPIWSADPSIDDPPPTPDDRATRRDRYRLIGRFAGRDDLLVREVPPVRENPPT